MKFILILLLLVVNPAYSFETSIEIDVSKCAKESCFKVFSEKLKIHDNLEILFWADTIDTFKKGYPSFYAMFNIINRTQEPVKLHILIDVQDANKLSLGKRVIETIVIPHTDMKSQYDIYRTINAIDLVDQGHIKARYVHLRIKEE